MTGVALQGVMSLRGAFQKKKSQLNWTTCLDLVWRGRVVLNTFNTICTATFGYAWAEEGDCGRPNWMKVLVMMPRCRGNSAWWSMLDQ